MLKKLKICCGCGSKDAVIVPESSVVGKSPVPSEKYVNELTMQESGMVDPMSNVSNCEINPAYMTGQWAPTRQASDYPINPQQKNSDDDSGMSEPIDA